LTPVKQAEALQTKPAAAPPVYKQTAAPAPKVVAEPKQEIPPKPAPKPNFTSYTKIINQNPAENQASETQDASEPEKSEPLPEPLLVAAWSEYAQSIKEKKISIYTILNAAPPKVVPDNPSAFEVIVDSNFHQQAIEGEKTNLLDFLKEKLKLKKLNMIINISKTETHKKPYTAQEKYAHMKSKNPDIDKLVDQLGLGLDT
jgi:DNA polymerase-3 subunit gamma/tau